MYASDIPDAHEYFRRELNYLRRRALEFARDYPTVAAELQLSQTKSADPHVEQLIQSFAFLTGRIHRALDNEYAEIPNGILESLHPHLAAPVPSMAIVQAQVKADGTNFSNGYRLAKQRTAYAPFGADGTVTVPCRFRTCNDLDLWPLAVAEADFVPTNHFPFLAGRPEVQSVLRVKIVTQGSDPLSDYPLRSLRFYINNDELSAHRLYRLLHLDLCGIEVRGEAAASRYSLSPGALEFIGFDQEHAVLPADESVHPGYRLLQEYFLFPEKFLFFELNSLRTEGISREMELLFLFSSQAQRFTQLTAKTLQLNCLPIINLFSSDIEPIPLDHRQYEYHVRADVKNHRWNEIYALTELEAVAPKGKPRKLTAFYSHTGAAAGDQGYYWISRRENSQSQSIAGTEYYVSFHDNHFEPDRPADEVIAGKALCTNRRLPERLSAGQYLLLEGPGPVDAFKLVSQPTRHLSPQLHGVSPWNLVSDLKVNHLSLGNAQECLPALKTILALHAGDTSAANSKMIESIARMECQRVVRQVGRDAWRGYCRGTSITLTIDESICEGGNVLLFGEVLQRFFSLYATINSFTQMALKTKQRKGVIKEWQPLAGGQALL